MSDLQALQLNDEVVDMLMLLDYENRPGFAIASSSSLRECFCSVKAFQVSRGAVQERR